MNDVVNLRNTVSNDYSYFFFSSLVNNSRAKKKKKKESSFHAEIKSKTCFITKEAKRSLRKNEQNTSR